MARTYEGSHQEYDFVCENNVMVPMRDGVKLATDLYFPAVGERRAEGKFPVIATRTPYNKLSAHGNTTGEFFARRGYIFASQDVRGRFESEGEWYAFAKEAPDGYDTVEWLGVQPWSTGRVGTTGGSYTGSDQAALATLDPPHLATMTIANAASNYYHSSMRQNGALEQRFHIYAIWMALNSKEVKADPSIKGALIRAFTQELPDIVDRFPLREGSSVLRMLPTYERWAIDILTHGEYDDYWKQRGYAMSEYYDEFADVPTLYMGAWYDSYVRNTCESYVALSKMKKSPQRLLVGPWTHTGASVTFSGDLDHGLESQTDTKSVRLAWFDHYLKDMHTEVVDWSPVRVFTMGTGSGNRDVMDAQSESFEDYPGRIDHGGYWRNEADWPLPGTRFTPYYLHGDGSLSPEAPEKDELSPTSFTFDPKDPVRTIGGGISVGFGPMVAGAYDQRGRPDTYGFHRFKDTLPLNSRADVLSFETPALDEDTEVTGPIEMHLWASSSALDTDFTAKLVDVFPPHDDYPEGLAINITDSIIRARYRNGWEKAELMEPGQHYEFVFQLYPTSNIFPRGHRIRLDISSSNWPRFDLNPNTGGPLGLHRSWQVAHQSVYHDGGRPSHIVLPLQTPKGS